MLITICIPNATAPAITAISDEQAADSCRTFSDLRHSQAWLLEHGITIPCGRLELP